MPANHGRRSQLTISGVPVGNHLLDTLGVRIAGVTTGSISNTSEKEWGSIIIVLATDAPLLPSQLKRLAQRIPLGLTRTGAIGGNSSGDIFIAFSTANKNAFSNTENQNVITIPNENMNALFTATIRATEEAIINALFAAETTEGIFGNKAFAIPKERVVQIMKQYNRIK